MAPWVLGVGLVRVKTGQTLGHSRFTDIHISKCVIIRCIEIHLFLVEKNHRDSGDCSWNQSLNTDISHITLHIPFF